MALGNGHDEMIKCAVVVLKLAPNWPKVTLGGTSEPVGGPKGAISTTRQLNQQSEAAKAAKMRQQTATSTI